MKPHELKKEYSTLNKSKERTDNSSGSCQAEHFSLDDIVETLKSQDREKVNELVRSIGQKNTAIPVEHEEKVAQVIIQVARNFCRDEEITHNCAFILKQILIKCGEKCFKLACERDCGIYDQEGLTARDEMRSLAVHFGIAILH